MNYITKNALFMTSALILLPVAQATAQREAAPTQSAQAQSAQGPAMSGLEEIVVTARKREERAQDIPISLTVTSGEQLRQKSLTQFIELQRQTPALHVVSASVSNTTLNLAMRGQVLVDIRLNIDPAISVYQDGVYLPRAQGANSTEMLDLQRVEILAGPQGTLFGKNTTGGALNIFTNTPTDKFEGSVTGRYGKFGEHSVSAVLNVPLSSQFAVRAVANASGRDGYGMNLTDNTPAGEINARYFRATALWTPSDALKVTLRGDYSRNKSTQNVYKGVLLLNPLTPGVGLGGPTITVETAMEQNNITGGAAAFLALPVATRTAMLTAADATLRNTYFYTNGSPDSQALGTHSAEDMRVWGFSGTIDYELSDSLSFKSITGERFFIRQGSADLDGTPYKIIDYPFMRTRDRQFSEEAQLSGNFLDGRLRSIAGVYYSNESGFETTFQTSVANIATPVAATTMQFARVNNKSFGLFTQHTYKLTDQLSVTGGIRWSKDDRFVNAMTQNQVTCSVLGVSLASIGGSANCQRPMETKFKKVSYNASIEYKITGDALLYFTTRRGYRAGGLQETAIGTTAAVATVANTPFRPEILTDYEGGVKTEWFDHRLRANLIYFHSNVTDAIRNVSTPVPGTTTTAANAQNAASEKIDGVEFDVVGRPVPEIELGVNGAWTKGKFGSYITPTGEDRTSLPLLFTPKWQINLSAAYIAEMPFGEWRTQLDYSWSDRMLTAEANAFQEAHGILNARTSIKWEAHELDVSLYMKNVTDKRYLTYPIDLQGGLGFFYAGQFNPPRTYGIEITKSF